MTPAEQRGFVVGNTYRVRDDSGAFSAGSVVVFERDDGSHCPLFKLVLGHTPFNLAEGRSPGAYEELSNLTAGIDEDTYAKRAGFTVVGKEGWLIGNHPTGVEADTRIALEEDDGTEVVKFRILTGEREGISIWVPLYQMENGFIKCFAMPEEEEPTEGSFYKVVDNNILFSKGTIVCCVEGDNSMFVVHNNSGSCSFNNGPNRTPGAYVSKPTFQRALRKATAKEIAEATVKNEEEFSLTPAQQKGYSVGDKFEVVTKSHGGSLLFQHSCKVGDILTFIRDDATSNPYFEDQSGDVICPELENLRKVVAVTSTNEGETDMTPAQRAGLKVGDKVRVVAPIGSEDRPLHGKVLTLHRDDNSNCPWFRDEDGTSECPFLMNVVKLEDAPNLPEGQVQVGDQVQAGDILINREGERFVADMESGPDSDNEYSVQGGYLNADTVVAIVRPVSKDVDVTVTVSEQTRDLLRSRGALLEECEIEGYSVEFKRAVVELVNAVENQA